MKINDNGEEVIPRRSFDYDYLIISVGSVSHDFGIKGVTDHCLFLDTATQAETFQTQLLESYLRAHTQGKPVDKGQLDIAIVGAGATGVELSAQLHEVSHLLTAYGLDEVKPTDTTEAEKTDVVKNENESQKKSGIIIAKTDETVAVKEPVIEPEKENNVLENNKIEELPIVVKDRDTSSERDLLISARNAFNQGAMIESEKFYLELTQLDQDNPDAFGELGNVYYSQGKWDEAGQAYYEAAVRLISAGNHNQVVYLQRVINGLNTEHAEKLAQLMTRQ